jgi:catechol 2,3-dioxygenase-like lactoylglutathione lyase family enzyme
MKVQPLITVRDVARSSRFYQRVLDARSGHGGDEYDRIVRDGNVLLQLHRREAHEHPHLLDESAPLGNGVLLWFFTDRFDAGVERVSDVGAEILEPPHWNELAGHRECLFLDPDGYKVVLASPYGDRGSAG